MFRERGFCSIEEVDQSRSTSPCRYKLEIKDNEDHEVIFYQNEAIKDIKTFFSYPNDHLVLLRSDIVKVTFLDQLIFVPKQLEEGKMKVKRRTLSLHDSLKNLYLQHFARYGRSDPNLAEEDYEDKADFLNYY